MAQEVSRAGPACHLTATRPCHPSARPGREKGTGAAWGDKSGQYVACWLNRERGRAAPRARLRLPFPSRLSWRGGPLPSERVLPWWRQKAAPSMVALDTAFAKCPRDMLCRWRCHPSWAGLGWLSPSSPRRLPLKPLGRASTSQGYPRVTPSPGIALHRPITVPYLVFREIYPRDQGLVCCLPEELGDKELSCYPSASREAKWEPPATGTRPFSLPQRMPQSVPGWAAGLGLAARGGGLEP